MRDFKEEAEAACRERGYQLLELLGKGAQGEVYQARDATGGACAIKMEYPDDNFHKRCKQRCRLDREVRIHSLLKHPNIVRFKEVGLGPMTLLHRVGCCSSESWPDRAPYNLSHHDAHHVNLLPHHGL